MVEYSSNHQNNNAVNKPRKLWLAIALHIICPGLGQFYNNKFKNAAIMYCLLLIIFITGSVFTVITESFLTFIIIIFIQIIIWSYILIDAIVLTYKNKNIFYAAQYNNRWYKYILVIIIVACINIPLDYFRTKYIFETYVESAGSMEDTLLPGDIIAVKKYGYDQIKTNDIILFKYPQNEDIIYIKRCVAKGGQTIEIRDKNLYVDGELKSLPPMAKLIDKRIIPYHQNQQAGGMRDNMPLTTVPDSQLFVLGDNRDNSSDSRFWGFVKDDQIIGKAMFVTLSWEKEYSGVRWDRIGMKIE